MNGNRLINALPLLFFGMVLESCPFFTKFTENVAKTHAFFFCFVVAIECNVAMVRKRESIASIRIAI